MATDTVKNRNIISFVLMALLVQLLSVTASVHAQTINEAHYSKPVTRYGHFALGRPHEYAQLNIVTDNKQRHVLVLPEGEVFEDLSPRLVHLAASQDPALLTIISNRNSGARLALVRLIDNELLISSQSPPIGTPMRWLNPVGVADLDGDGQAEVAAVITPHIGGRLKVYKERGDELVEVAALAGFSNHVYHSDVLSLSVAMPVGGKMRLLVPDFTRRFLRIIALRDGALVEVGRCPFSEPISGALMRISDSKVSVNSSEGKQTLSPLDCVH